MATSHGYWSNGNWVVTQTAAEADARWRQEHGFAPRAGTSAPSTPAGNTNAAAPVVPNVTTPVVPNVTPAIAPAVNTAAQTQQTDWFATEHGITPSAQAQQTAWAQNEAAQTPVPFFTQMNAAWMPPAPSQEQTAAQTQQTDWFATEHGVTPPAETQQRNWFATEHPNAYPQTTGVQSPSDAWLENVLAHAGQGEYTFSGGLWELFGNAGLGNYNPLGGGGGGGSGGGGGGGGSYGGWGSSPGLIMWRIGF